MMRRVFGTNHTSPWSIQQSSSVNSAQLSIFLDWWHLLKYGEILQNHMASAEYHLIFIYTIVILYNWGFILDVHNFISASFFFCFFTKWLMCQFWPLYVNKIYIYIYFVCPRYTFPFIEKAERMQEFWFHDTSEQTG